MSINLEENVQILSEHYVNRFKHLIDTNRREDAYSIGQEYVCKGEVEDDNYQWFFARNFNPSHKVDFISGMFVR